MYRRLASLLVGVAACSVDGEPAGLAREKADMHNPSSLEVHVGPSDVSLRFSNAGQTYVDYTLAQACLMRSVDTSFARPDMGTARVEREVVAGFLGVRAAFSEVTETGPVEWAVELRTFGAGTEAAADTMAFPKGEVPDWDAPWLSGARIDGVTLGSWGEVAEWNIEIATFKALKAAVTKLRPCDKVRPRSTPQA